MKKPNWADSYPMLYDLYQESDTENPDNYFNKFEEALLLWEVRRQYQELDTMLAKLDINAWKSLKKKALKYISRKGELRAYEQFMNTLQEAKGYIFLKDKGCSEVKFIPESNWKTPDLIGTKDGLTWLLENKTINPSTEELEIIRANSAYPVKEMQVIQVQQGIPSTLIKKIQSTIETARDQLLAYHDEKVSCRSVFLSIKLDKKISLDSRNIEALSKFLQSLHYSDIELHYQITH